MLLKLRALILIWLFTSISHASELDGKALYCRATEGIAKDYYLFAERLFLFESGSKIREFYISEENPFEITKSPSVDYGETFDRIAFEGHILDRKTAELWAPNNHSYECKVSPDNDGMKFLSPIIGRMLTKMKKRASENKL